MPFESRQKFHRNMIRLRLIDWFSSAMDLWRHLLVSYIQGSVEGEDALKKAPPPEEQFPITTQGVNNSVIKFHPEIISPEKKCEKTTNLMWLCAAFSSWCSRNQSSSTTTRHLRIVVPSPMRLLPPFSRLSADLKWKRRRKLVGTNIPGKRPLRNGIKIFWNGQNC